MWNPFKKKSVTEDVLRPVTGTVIPLEEVPDRVFSRRALGGGFAVLPSDGTFRAPVDGELILLAKTLHAFAIRTPAGAEVLVHIGIDTVLLKGEGFTAERAQGDIVRAGDPIVRVDLEAVTAKVPSMATPVILTNGTVFQISEPDAAAAPDAPVASVAPLRG